MSAPPISSTPPALAPPTPDEIALAVNTLSRANFLDVQRLGWHFQRNDFYSPLNNCDFLERNRDLWASFDPLDIDWRIEHQLGVAREVGSYAQELRDVPQETAEPGVFRWKNRMWTAADPIVQYGLFRSRKPRRVVEVGCGWSSLLMATALNRNEAEGAHRAEVTQIEPYPSPEIMPTLPSHWKQHTSILQRAPLSIFDELGDGDVLFYDGSHCAKAASDVNWFFFRVLPRLKRGVLIHLHDIFLPSDYDETWIFKRGQTWNEQYILQAFMMNNHAYQVEIANRFLYIKHRDELRVLYGDLQPVHGASFWLRKVQGPG